MWRSKKFSNFEWCSGWNNGVMGSWTTWFLGFNKRGVWIKRGGAKFGQFLINVVPEITELWVENSQETNCRDVTSIREGRAVTGKTPFFVIGPFCIHHFICLIAGFWYDSFTWKLCVFNLNTFNKNLFQKVCFKVKVLKMFKISADYHTKTCWSLEQRAIFRIPGTEEPMLFLLVLKWNV